MSLDYPLIRLTKLVLIICSLHIGTSFAGIIQYSFQGELERITDDFNYINDEFTAGTEFSGIFSYSTEAVQELSYIGDDSIGLYSAIINLEVKIGGYTLHGDSSNSAPGYLQVWDNRIVGNNTVDAFTVASPLDFKPLISGMEPGNIITQANLNFFDYSSTASLDGIAIPSAVNISGFSVASFSAIQLNTTTQEVFHLNGKITSLTRVKVPEPSTIAIFAIGFIVLASRKFKRTYNEI